VTGKNVYACFSVDSNVFSNTSACIWGKVLCSHPGWPEPWLSSLHFLCSRNDRYSWPCLAVYWLTWSLENFRLGWPGITILLISASQVARIIGENPGFALIFLICECVIHGCRGPWHLVCARHCSAHVIAIMVLTSSANSGEGAGIASALVSQVKKWRHKCHSLPEFPCVVELGSTPYYLFSSPSFCYVLWSCAISKQDVQLPARLVSQWAPSACSSQCLEPVQTLPRLLVLFRTHVGEILSSLFDGHLYPSVFLF
jgi:hypothetical protein